MKQDGRIAGYSVNKKHISVRIELLGDVSPLTVQKLQGYKGKMKTLRLDTLQLAGEIASISLNNTTGFLIHAEKYEYINRSLFTIMNKDMVCIHVSDKVEDKILLFLNEAARVTGKNRVQLLCEITSFKNIKGKKAVFHLSNEQKKIVLDKLNKILHRKSETLATASGS
ncbi:MAG: hypothetical protein KA801_00740 [Syntrophorhabdaceae bacterium]|nr:hypothetical protein [Syntrophorhabdaceae bacterium]